MPTVPFNTQQSSSPYNHRNGRSILFKLAILKASGWALVTSACLIHFKIINSGASLGAELITTLCLGASAVILGLLLSRGILTTAPLIRFMYLLSDVVFLAAAIHFTGGIINPFTSSLLVPIALAVTLLPRFYTLILITIACSIYGYWLMSVDQTHMAHHNFSLHLYGMGINFLLSAILLTIFISHALESVKIHEKALVAAREKMIKDEQIVGIASLTANTAHALGTPLQILALITEDLTPENTLDKDTLFNIKQQLNKCQEYLQQLVHTAKVADFNENPKINILELIQKIEHHYSLQPHNKNIIYPTNHHSEIFINYNESLFFAIINLIENALRAAQNTVAITIKNLHNKAVILSIANDGEGIPEYIAHEIGSPFIHNSQPKKGSTNKGLGLGYYLSSYTIEQNNGKILMYNAPTSGTITEVHLPLL